MRQITVKEGYGYDGKTTIGKDHASGIFIEGKGTSYPELTNHTPHQARKLFQAGLQMCDELEKEL